MTHKTFQFAKIKMLLPPDVLYKILCEVSPKDLLHFALTNKQHHELIFKEDVSRDRLFWKNYAIIHFKLLLDGNHLSSFKQRYEAITWKALAQRLNKLDFDDTYHVSTLKILGI